MANNRACIAYPNCFPSLCRAKICVVTVLVLPLPSAVLFYFLFVSVWLVGLEALGRGLQICIVTQKSGAFCPWWGRRLILLVPLGNANARTFWQSSRRAGEAREVTGRGVA